MKSESEVTQLCLTLSDPMDCSPPGSSIHGIFQARVLEWGAIAFSEDFASRFILAELENFLLFLGALYFLFSECLEEFTCKTIKMETLKK